MSRKYGGPYVIFDTRYRKYFCVGLRNPEQRGWHSSSKDATTFATRTEAAAAKAGIQVFGRTNRGSIAIIPAPKVAQENAEDMHTAAQVAA
jgi:hypothetical protein